MDITDSCLDAETLAAWVDGGLTAPELGRAQAHVADCVRCQAMLGTLARINAAAPVVKTEAAWRGWLGWLVPLTAAAAAVTIWVAMPASNLDTRVTAPQAPASIADLSEAKAKDQPASPPPAPTPMPAKTEEAALSQAPASASASASVMDAKEKRSEGAVPADALGKVTSADTGVAAPPAAPAPAAEAVTVTGVAPIGAQGGAPIRPRAGAPSANAMESAPSMLRRDFASPAEIVSPDPTVRWRIVGSGGSGGSGVERTTNGGAAWETTPTGVTTPLTAGAAPSPTTVWMVGRSGVVLLSTDGRTWRRLPFPEITDLSSVRARDARTASVTTADGRVFSTTTAGATWVPGPLQGF